MSKEDKLMALRHSAEHVLTMAMLRLWPGKIKAAMGPATEDGFYFDFDSDIKISEDDFPKIEKEMSKIIKRNLPITKGEMTVAEAKKFFSYNTYKDNEYKHEWLDSIKSRGEKVSVYWLGPKDKDIPESFVDICSGPHVKSTGEIKAFKLTKIAGAYWHGDEKNKMLQRIYGVAFDSQSELKKYLELLAEAEKRDHRRLGQELDLFMIDDEIGAGLPLWLPKGALLRQKLEQFVLNVYQHKGYQLVITPHIASHKLFQKSGHLGFYKENIYSPMNIEDENFYIKPMNCPFHVKIYQHAPKSYRDLPLRYTELGTVYRFERSGTLHGLTRVRGFTQDDAHIICTPDQLTDELVGVINLTKYILETFGFKKFKVALSVRDPKNKKKYLGTDKEWDLAEKGLKEALKISKWDYVTEEGEAVFYGPKIDIKIFDAVGREWQTSTLQLDFNLPEKFDMTYVDKDGTKQRPFMLHRALLGSVERFTGVLIEHYAGAFPLWLSPEQLRIITVGEAHIKHATKLAEELTSYDIRVELDKGDETVGNKIRKALKQKIPYILVIGDKEVKSDKFHVRKRGSDKVEEIAKDKFITHIQKIIQDKSAEL